MPKSSSDAIAIFKALRMNIPGRARKLRLDLGKLEGIRVIDFNYIVDIVAVSYDAKRLTLDAIRNTINGALPS